MSCFEERNDAVFDVCMEKFFQLNYFMSNKISKNIATRTPSTLYVHHSHFSRSHNTLMYP